MITPFHDIPKKTYFIRILGPTLAFVFLLLFGIGLLKNSAQLHSKSGGVISPVWETVIQFYQGLYDQYLNIPNVCWWSSAVSEFQNQKCHEYWNSFHWELGLALLPFMLSVILVVTGLEILGMLYGNLKNRAESGTADFGGVVIRTQLASHDAISWFFCFNIVWIELADKRRMKVYVPAQCDSLELRDVLAVFKLSILFGFHCHVAIPYTPHVAVVRGV